MIEEHRWYLRDRHRIAAYDRALHEVLPANSIVVDLASGTGILGMLACRAGAARVYAIERTGMAGLARDIARANGFEERIVGLRGRSATVVLPERADVAVCDQLGPFGVDGGILEVSRHARDRFLRSGGTLVPSQLALMLALVEDAALFERIGFWRTRPAGFDLSAAADVAANAPYRVGLRADRLSSLPEQAAALDLTRETDLPLRLSAMLRVARDGLLHGVGGWFNAVLSPSVEMTNAPGARHRIKRRQMFFPILEAAPVRAGDLVTVSIRILPHEGMYSWDVEVGGRQRFRQTTLRGLMMTREDLLRTDPAFRPERTPEVSARLTVLRLCDGLHTLGDIERAVYVEHGDLFLSPAEAAAFVARVLA